jgi:hypothetical protein
LYYYVSKDVPVPTFPLFPQERPFLSVFLFVIFQLHGCEYRCKCSAIKEASEVIIDF